MSELSLEQRLLIVSETIRLTEKAFAHWENATFVSDELGTISEEFFSKAVKAEHRLDFQFVMWEYFGKLRNGHSNYFDRAALFPHGGMFSFSLLELDGEWVVKEDDTGLMEPGDVVESIGGRTLLDWVDGLSHLTGITDWRSMSGRMPYYISYLLKEEKVEVELTDKHGSSRFVTMLRTPIDFEALNRGETTGKWLQIEKVAYIRIPSFNHLKFEERALALLEEFRDAIAIIIDVRGNSGGSTPSTLTQRLMDRPYRWWKERARHPEFLSQRHQKAEIRFAPDYSYAECGGDYIDPTPGIIPYKGKLAILVDRFSGSAAEDFVQPFLDNGRATIVGERTCGSTGQPLFRNFDDNNILVTVGAVRSYMPNGASFEGIGIVPKLEVSRRRDDLYSKRDNVLEKALESVMDKT